MRLQEAHFQANVAFSQLAIGGELSRANYTQQLGRTSTQLTKYNLEQVEREGKVQYREQTGAHHHTKASVSHVVVDVKVGQNKVEVKMKVGEVARTGERTGAINPPKRGGSDGSMIVHTGGSA